MKKGIILGLVIILSVVLIFTYLAMRNNIAETEAECFVFNEETKTIEEFKKFCGSKLSIPSKINGITVEKIANYVFRDSSLEVVVIPSTVIEIGTGAFYGNNIKDLTLNEGVEQIKPYAFYDNKIERLTIPDSVIRVGVAAFNKNEIKESEAFIYFRNDEGEVNDTILVGYGGKSSDVTIPNQVKTVYLNAFSDLGIKNVTIPEGLERIEFSAFSGNDIETITIPKSVLHIGESAFYNNPLDEIKIEGKSDADEFNFLGEEWHGGSTVKFEK